MRVLIETDVIEDKEFGFGAEKAVSPTPSFAGTVRPCGRSSAGRVRSSVVSGSRISPSITSVGVSMNGSMKAVVESGMRSMSLSLMAAQPRMLDHQCRSHRRRRIRKIHRSDKRCGAAGRVYRRSGCQPGALRSPSRIAELRLVSSLATAGQFSRRRGFTQRAQRAHREHRVMPLFDLLGWSRRLASRSSFSVE